MTNIHASDEIARLEDQIERLAATIENCRKVIFICKGAIISGVLLAASLALGVVNPGPIAILCAISLLLFGIVGFGSNWSTLKQSSAALNQVEQMRQQLISNMELRLVVNEEAGEPR
jgi:hypothetical protein